MARVTAFTLRITSNNQTRETIQQIADLQLGLDGINKRLREARREGNQSVYRDLSVQARAFREGIRSLNRDLRQQISDLRQIEPAAGSYNNLRNRVRQLTDEFKALGREARNGIAGQRLIRDIENLNLELRQVDQTIGGLRGRLGSFLDSFRGFRNVLAGAGLALGIQEAVQAAREAIRVFAEFQQNIATLGAVAGANAQELGELEREARRLGETTQFTAVQISELQTILARRGFRPDEIIDATEDIVNLSIATQESIERTADVTSAALRGFNLTTDQTQRLTDVLTASFNSSANNLKKFGEAIKFVAPVAASANIDLETTAAALSALADAGLEGSTQGTVLRRVITDLANENSDLAEFLGRSVKSSEDFQKAIEDLSQANLDAGASFELVGRVGQTGLTILANEAPKIARLTEQFRNANDVARITAEIVGDTLAQDILKAQSAIEGLRINLVDLADESLRGVVQGFTNFVGVINEYLGTSVITEIEDERLALNGLVLALIDAEDNQEARNRIIAQLQVQYPDFLANLGEEELSTENLATALELANDQYRAQILLKVADEQIDKQRQAVQSAINKEAEQGIAFARALTEAREFLGDQTLTAAEAVDKLRESESRSFTLGGQVRNRQAELVDDLIGFQNGLSQAEIERAESATALTRAEEQKNQTLEILREQYPGIIELLEQSESAEKDYGDQLDISSLKTSELTREIRRLKSELVSAEGNEELSNSIKAQLNLLEAELNSRGDVFSPIEEQSKAASGSTNALREAIRELEEQIGNTTGGSDDLPGLVADLEKLEKELEAVEKEIDSLRTSEPIDLSNIIGALETDLSLDSSLVDPDQIAAEIEAINVTRFQKIAEARQNEELSEEELAQKRKEINLLADIEILRARIALTEEGSSERLKIAQQIADKEVEIEKNKNTKVKREQEVLRKQLFDIALDAANSVASSIIQIEQNVNQRDFSQRQAAIEAESAQRIEAAQGNADLIEQINQQTEQQRQELAREAARADKEIALKRAAIDGALAVIKAFATIPPPLNAIAAAAAAVATAAQIAVISSQEFARGGVVNGRPHTQGGEKFTVRSTGQRVELEGGEGVINKRSMASNDTMTVTGTPRQIASSINSMRGYGVKFQGGGIIESTTPQLVNPNSDTAIQPGANTVELSDSQIEQIANVIAARTGAAVKTGVTQGLNDANRIAEREELLNQELSQ